MPLSPTAVSVSGSRELLPRVLHEIAQPLSALECSLELALVKNFDRDRCVRVLEDALSITHHLSERVVFFRDLDNARGPCDCLRPVDGASAVAAAVEEVRDLAESLGARIQVSVGITQLYGNREKLLFALVRLFDWLLQNGAPAQVTLICEEECIGEIKLPRAAARNKVASETSLELVRTALATLGAHLDLEVLEAETRATIYFSSYRHPQASTSVLLGDF